MTPLFISFHTGGNYQRHAEGLADTLRQFGLPFEIEQLPNAGNWCHNCAMKSHFVRSKLNDKRPIVWIDADARIRNRPEALLKMPANIDFAAHWLDGRQLCSGTLYFGTGPAARKLVEDWHLRCKMQPDVWDQEHLADAITSGVSVFRLDEGYVRIFDRTNPIETVFIEHLQASRQPHD